MKKIELLAPVGSLKKLYTALHFGADAVYLAGTNFGLRAYASNFTRDELITAVNYTHGLQKKVYVTVNIFADNRDFIELGDYLKFLYSINVDAIIVSDAGIIAFAKKTVPNLEIHLSTQANTTNMYAIEFWRDMGVARVVLAREMSLEEIKETSAYLGDSIELEAFVHGAMCISYSGRCLLSNYLTNRNSNRGECVQACRWEYQISEVKRPDHPLTISEDERGTYILNSKDMSTLAILEQIIDAGIVSLKIEGRMKSEYYIGTVVNSYRKGIDAILSGQKVPVDLIEDLFKVNHRDYTSGFYLGQDAEVCLSTSTPINEYVFVAEVLDYDTTKKAIVCEQRNRFAVGDSLEILSPSPYHNNIIIPHSIKDAKDNDVFDCKNVQQLLYIASDISLQKGDMLRKKII